MNETPVILPVPDEVLGAVTMIVREIAARIDVHEREETRRAEIRAYRDREMARIEATERLIREGLQKAYDERAMQFRGLFGSLDKAMAIGDLDAISHVLACIGALGLASPLADVSNFGSLWNDTEYTWEV